MEKGYEGEYSEGFAAILAVIGAFLVVAGIAGWLFNNDPIRLDSFDFWAPFVGGGLLFWAYCINDHIRRLRGRS